MRLTNIWDKQCGTRQTVWNQDRQYGTETEAVWNWDKILLVEVETLFEMDPLVCGSVKRCGEGAQGGTGEGCVLGGNGLACFMFTYLPRERI